MYKELCISFIFTMNRYFLFQRLKKKNDTSYFKVNEKKIYKRKKMKKILFFLIGNQSNTKGKKDKVNA